MSNNPNKPPPPVKPVEKLPLTYHLTIVPIPEKGDRMLALVAMKMQGDEVRKRLVLGSYLAPQDALDEMNRVATRLFYFEEPENVFGTEG